MPPACLPACLSTDVATNCRDIRSSGNKANVHARVEVYERPGFRLPRLRGDNLLHTLSFFAPISFGFHIDEKSLARCYRAISRDAITRNFKL